MIKLSNLLLESPNEVFDILFDDATNRAVAFGCTHDVLNLKDVSPRVKLELEKQKSKGKCPTPPEGKAYKGVIGYGWEPMWNILQKVKSGQYPKVDTLFIDSDIKYNGLENGTPEWKFTDNQKLEKFISDKGTAVSHGLTGGDTLAKISKEYSQTATKAGLTPNDMNYYLPYGIGLVTFLVQKENIETVGRKINQIVIHCSSGSAAQHFMALLQPHYRGKVKRIIPRELNSNGFIA